MEVWEENGNKEVEKQSQTLGSLKDWEDREWGSGPWTDPQAFGGSPAELHPQVKVTAPKKTKRSVKSTEIQNGLNHLAQSPIWSKSSLEEGIIKASNYF